MAGTKAGGQKAAKTILERYGKDFYAERGRKGGKVSTPTGGFGASPARAKRAGAIGGRTGRRGYQVEAKLPDGTILYTQKSTDEKYKLEPDGKNLIKCS